MKDEGPSEDRFPDEHLFAASIKTSLFNYGTNNIVEGFFQHNFLRKKKKIADRKIGLITWVDGTLFKLGLHSEDVQQEED